MKEDKFMRILAIYVNSMFQDFENFLRTKVGLVEVHIKFVSDEYNSSFITDKLTPGIYTFKDLSEALFNILQSEHPGPSNVIDTEVDDITRKSKVVVRSSFIAIGFDEKLSSSTILTFQPHWDYKHYIQYISQKIVNLSTTDRIHLKCDVSNGSVVNGVREPMFFCSLLDKPSGYKVFCEPETFHYKKVNKSFLNTIFFHLEDDNNEVNFNGETLTFSLQMKKN